MLPDREVYKLLHPVEFGGKVIEELAVRTRIRGKDMRAAKSDMTDTSWAGQMSLIAVLSGQPDAVIDELDVADIENLVVLVRGFLERSRMTGSNGSPSSVASSDSAPGNS